MSSMLYINEDRASPWEPVAVLSLPYISVPSLTTALMALRNEAPSWPWKPVIVRAPVRYFPTQQGYYAYY